MFYLCTMTNQIRIEPGELTGALKEHLASKITRKYANKIIPHRGLAISLYSIPSIGDAHIYPGDGASHVTCTFRLLCFQPFENEAMIATIEACSSEGIRATIGFFNNIYISREMLKNNMTYCKEKNMWNWEEDDNDFELTVEDELRIIVKSIQYNTSIHTPDDTSSSTIFPEAHMVIHASIHDKGLGEKDWW